MIIRLGLHKKCLVNQTSRYNAVIFVQCSYCEAKNAAKLLLSLHLQFHYTNILLYANLMSYNKLIWVKWLKGMLTTTMTLCQLLLCHLTSWHFIILCLKSFLHKKNLKKKYQRSANIRYLRVKYFNQTNCVHTPLMTSTIKFI